MKRISSRYNYLIAIGLSILITGIFMIVLEIINSKVSSSLISIGITIIIIAFFRKIRKKSMPEKDERIKKLSMYGLGYSWITTFLVITLFFWFDYFELIKITTQHYYSIIFGTMILSAIIFQKILYMKGDVE